MELKVDFKDLHKDTKMVILKAVIFVAALLLAGVLFIYPVYSEVGRLETDIEAAKSDLVRQRIFLPEYVRLNDLAESAAKDLPPVPKGEPLPMDQVDTLPTVLQTMAAEAGLEPLDVVISPGSLKQGAPRIMLQCIVSGDLASFQRFYEALSGYPHLYGVSRLEMQAVPGGLEMFVELWMALGNGPANNGNQG